METTVAVITDVVLRLAILDQRIATLEPSVAAQTTAVLKLFEDGVDATEAKTVLWAQADTLAALRAERASLHLGDVDVAATAEQAVEDSLLEIAASIEKAEQRRDEQIEAVAALAGQDRAQAQARHVLGAIEATLRQARQNYVLVQSVADPE